MSHGRHFALGSKSNGCGHPSTASAGDGSEPPIVPELVRLLASVQFCEPGVQPGRRRTQALVLRNAFVAVVLLAAFAGNVDVLSAVAERYQEESSEQAIGFYYAHLLAPQGQRRPAADVARAREAAEAQAQQICASVRPGDTGMQQALADLLLPVSSMLSSDQAMVPMVLEQTPAGQQRSAALTDLGYTWPSSSRLWFREAEARAMYDHEGQLLVALPQEVCGNINALANRLVVVNVRRLLAALLIDHCALDGIFFELIDGDYEEIELAQVIVLQGWCCGGSRPWMRVRIPGNEGGRTAINVCFVVLVSLRLASTAACRATALTSSTAAPAHMLVSPDKPSLSVERGVESMRVLFQ
ncbi:hypothetical protein JKP88DRAFT_309836 [Tribonema minus]|uniref:Uncharacterized protein n=1 Tax=Tribonema minus TaxID=303371 RepID=A0A835Z476_9STRA|nr:hypothetical protein JKP88DRAFT_309836 [Tribonema minus]